MPANLKNLDSFGGFSIGDTSIISETKDIINVNSLEVKNRFHNDSRTRHFILRGTNTSTLTVDNSNNTIPLDSDTISFVTGHVVGVAESGQGVLVQKLESAVQCNNAGVVTELSTMKTTIRDGIPSGESWNVNLFTTGAANTFSYNTIKSGSNILVKWFVYLQVVSIEWS